jgi:acetate kinase
MTNEPSLLLINAGSSSVKLTLRQGGRTVESRRHSREEPVDLAALAPARAIDAVVHRVVHAGDVRKHGLLTPAVEDAIREATPLAPLHNPAALHYIDEARRAFGPNVHHVAALDTAFFADLPQRASIYALPPEAGPVRRYGFHGLAHAFMSRRCMELDFRRPRRLVTLQLGAGCSGAAVLDGHPIDTSMGFSPAEGLMMATRSGDLDPGLIIHWVRTRGYGADALARMIEARGGLLGVCGEAGMPDVLRRVAAGDQRAALALDLYCYRVCKLVGAYAAALGGIDAVVFAGGVGENAPEVRRRILEPLGWLGFELDGVRNAANDADDRITRADGDRAAWVVRLDEAAEMARIADALLRAV